MSTSRAIIGRKIKQQRKKKNLTQQELVDMLGVDRQYIWKLENGKKNLTFDYLDKVMKKLNSKHADFLNNNSNN